MSRCAHQGNSIAFHPHLLPSPASRHEGRYRATRKRSSRRSGGKEIESITRSKVWNRRSGGHGWTATDAAMSPISFLHITEHHGLVFSVYLMSPWDGHGPINIVKSQLYSQLSFDLNRLVSESDQMQIKHSSPKRTPYVICIFFFSLSVYIIGPFIRDNMSIVHRNQSHVFHVNRTGFSHIANITTSIFCGWHLNIEVHPEY